MSGTTFWGLVAQGGKIYGQKLEQSIVITQAELVDNAKQVPKGNGELTKVIAKVDGTDYVICQLTPENRTARMKVILDIGRKVDIAVEGPQKSQVHLIGYSRNDGVVPSTSGASKAANGVAKKDAAVALKADVKKQSREVSVALKNKQAEAVVGKKKGIVAQQEVDIDDDEDLESDNDDINDMLEFESSDEEDDDSEEDTGVDFGKAKLLSVKPSAKEVKNAAKKFNFDDDEDDEDSDDDDEEEQEDIVLTKLTKKTPKMASGVTELNTSKSATPEGLKKSVPVSDKSLTESPRKVFTKGGVIIEDLKVGDGAVAKTGKMVGVYYLGKLKSNNKVFDKNLSGKPFAFRLGKEEVIKGWDLGVEGMKIGGKRKLTIPANLGYGKRGAPPDIPPGATLVFEVELKKVS